MLKELKIAISTISPLSITKKHKTTMIASPSTVAITLDYVRQSWQRDFHKIAGKSICLGSKNKKQSC